MLSELLAEHGHGLVIQWHVDRIAALRFVGMNPCRVALHIDVGPFSPSTLACRNPVPDLLACTKPTDSL